MSMDRRAGNAANFCTIHHQSPHIDTATARTMENRTARLTLLIDPDKKRIFEDICAAKDLTPSQVVRQLIRDYIVANAGDRELPEWLTSAASKRPSGQA